MNRIYKSLCICILTVLLLTLLLMLFTYDGGQKPTLTLSSFLDGSFFEELQLSFADAFPGGEAMERAYGRLEEFYRFGEQQKTDTE